MSSLVRLQHTYFEIVGNAQEQHVRDLKQQKEKGKLKIPQKAVPMWGNGNTLHYLTMGRHQIPNIMYDSKQDLITIDKQPVHFTNLYLRNTLKDLALYRKLCNWRRRCSIDLQELKCVFESNEHVHDYDHWKQEIAISDSGFDFTNEEVLAELEYDGVTDLHPEVTCDATPEQCMQAVNTFNEMSICTNKSARLPCLYTKKPMWFYARVVSYKKTIADPNDEQIVYFYPNECELAINEACVLHTFQNFNIVTTLSEASYNVANEVIIDATKVTRFDQFGPHAAASLPPAPLNLRF